MPRNIAQEISDDLMFAGVASLHKAGEGDNAVWHIMWKNLQAERVIDAKLQPLLEAMDAIVYGAVGMNATSASVDIASLLKYHKLRQGLAEIPDNDRFKQSLRVKL